MGISRYDAIWEQIKRERKCIVEVHPLLQARVRKAVVKRKNRDVAFKVMNDHDYFYLAIQLDKEKNRITFELKQRLGLEGINHG